MKKLLLILFLSIVLASCGSSRRTTKTIIVNNEGTPNRTITKERKNKDDKTVITTTRADEVVTKSSNEKTIKKVIDFAKTFKGTRYKFGGTTKAGMDCSGLVFTSFANENVVLPRVSRDMATKGKKISLRDVTDGDLLFFKTSSRNRINHVGLVVENDDGDILFIHSTTSKGVIISSLNERYWNSSFVQARRVI